MHCHLQRPSDTAKARGDFTASADPAQESGQDQHLLLRGQTQGARELVGLVGVQGHPVLVARRVGQQTLHGAHAQRQQHSRHAWPAMQASTKACKVAAYLRKAGLLLLGCCQALRLRCCSLHRHHHLISLYAPPAFQQSSGTSIA